MCMAEGCDTGGHAGQWRGQAAQEGEANTAAEEPAEAKAGGKWGCENTGNE